jgi:hypothetical protein
MEICHLDKMIINIFYCTLSCNSSEFMSIHVISFHVIHVICHWAFLKIQKNGEGGQIYLPRPSATASMSGRRQIQQITNLHAHLILLPPPLPTVRARRQRHPPRSLYSGRSHRLQDERAGRRQHQSRPRQRRDAKNGQQHRDTSVCGSSRLDRMSQLRYV